MFWFAEAHALVHLIRFSLVQVKREIRAFTGLLLTLQYMERVSFFGVHVIRACYKFIRIIFIIETVCGLYIEMLEMIDYM